jgi:hypothetical protein
VSDVCGRHGRDAVRLGVEQRSRLVAPLGMLLGSMLRARLLRPVLLHPVLCARLHG